MVAFLVLVVDRFRTLTVWRCLPVAAIALIVFAGCEELVPEPTTPAKPAPQETSGSVSVASTPSGARIFLNRSDTGRVTPYVIPDLSVGSHSIHLTLAGHTDWGPQNVPVSAGQITTVFATLEPTEPPPPPGPDAPSERGLGLKRLDVQAYQSANIIRADPVSVPSSVDLSVDAPIPGDQGGQGSCVGWAVAYAVKSYHERIERSWPLTDDRHVMSPAYIYNQIRVPGGGAYFVDAFILLVEQGVSSWEQMPYDALDDRTQPSSRARAEAANYKIADWGTVLRTTHAVFVQELKRHLVAGTPVLLGIRAYPDFEYLSESNPVYDDDTGTSRGAHAVVIVGYDDRRSAFKIANSWGTDWGIGGYGWIDYDASESLIEVAYVTKDVVASPGDERPGATSDPSPGSAAISVAADTVLRWTRNARTTSFDVYLGVDPHLSAVDFQGNVAQAEFAPHLAPGSRYYWRVDARGAGGITQGPVWTFTTAGMLEEPGKAVNPSPANGATGVVQDPVLRWDSGGHTTSYDVYLGTASRLGASELQQTQATRTYYPRGLRAGTRYYWRIDAKNGQGTTPGDVWTFTTVQAREQDTSPVLPSISNKVYLVGDYVNEKLPAATGGNGRLTYSLTPSIRGLTFDASFRTLDGTARAPGTYHMRYRVQDDDGDTDSQPFTVTVNEVQPSNQAPTAVGAIADLDVLLDTTTEVDVADYFSDPDGDTLTYAAVTSATYVAVSIYGSMVSITGRAVGPAIVTVTATDPDGLFATQTIPVLVLFGEQDTSPVLPSISDKAYPVGDYVSEPLPAATGGNGRLTYSLTPSIRGLTFDAGSRTLYGTPREAGTYHMRYRATDEDGDTDRLSFTITVVERDTSPVLPSMSDKTYDKGATVNERLPAATGGNGTLSYSLTPSVSGLTFESATRTLYGTPREAGTYHMRYRVQDDDGDTDSQPFTITVVRQELMLPRVSSRTYTQGIAITPWALPAATGGTGVVDYELWGIPPGLSMLVDGQQLHYRSRWSIPGDSPDSFLLSGTPTEAGTYNLRYRVRDAYGDTDDVSFTIAVTVNCNSRPSPRGKIYWTSPETGRILRANLSGTDVETIYHRPPVQAPSGRPGDGPGGQYRNTPIGVAISGDKIYWVDESSVGVRRANLDGTCVERLVAGGTNPLTIAVANGKMYWTDYGEKDRIKRANLDGTRIEALYSSAELPGEIAISGGKMYWTSRTRTGTFDTTGTGIRRANLDGTGIELLVTGIANPYGIAVADDKMYWTDRIHWGVSGGGKIQRANLDGTNVETLVSNLRQPLSLVIHGGRIYWIENHGAIKSAALNGTDVQLLVEPEAKGTFGRGLAIH